MDLELRSVERVFLTLKHVEPDYVPLADHIYMAMPLEGVLGEKGVRTNTPEKYVRVHRLLGLDLICAFSNGSEVRPMKPETGVSVKEAVDEWGMRHRVINGMAWYLGGPIKTIDDFDLKTQRQLEDFSGAAFAAIEASWPQVKGNM